MGARIAEPDGWLRVLRCVSGCPWGLAGRIADELSALVVEEDDARLFREVEAVQLHRRVVADILEAPQVAAAFPKHRGVGHAGLVEEVLYSLKVILGANANDLYELCVVSSELLDV